MEESGSSSLFSAEVCWKCLHYSVIAIASIGLPILWHHCLQRREEKGSNRPDSGEKEVPTVNVSSPPEDETEGSSPIVVEQVQAEKTSTTMDPPDELREPVQEEMAMMKEESKDEAVQQEEEEEGEEDDIDLDDLLLPAATVLEVETRHTELRPISPGDIEEEKIARNENKTTE